MSQFQQWRAQNSPKGANSHLNTMEKPSTPAQHLGMIPIGLGVQLRWMNLVSTSLVKEDGDIAIQPHVNLSQRKKMFNLPQVVGL